MMCPAIIFSFEQATVVSFPYMQALLLKEGDNLDLKFFNGFCIA
jgi:hypothetical protein